MTVSVRRRVRAAGVLLGLAGLSMAHVGSPDTFFAGAAGPYAIRVTVRLPGVIPGRAQVSVRVAGATADTIRNVTVRAALWSVGLEGAPPAETAAAVPGDPELYATELWFMAPSSYRLFVSVDGSKGQGTAIVPMMALATAQRKLERGLGLVLAGLGTFLALGLLTIVGCAVRESALPPGTQPDTKRRRRARIAMAVATAVLCAIAWAGNLWWTAEASSYSRSVVYRPFESEATTRLETGRRVLTLAIRDARWPERTNPATRWNALIPDHGKLMHMFLIREPSMDAFAHLHPVVRTPSAHEFDVELPPLPAGRYRVYGDIVHESGYTQTLVASIDVPAATASRAAGDPDDSWFEGEAVPEGSAAAFRFADGTSIVWLRGEQPTVVGDERLLTFVARDASGRPLPLEPYMGMLGHAAVASEDGTVFAHLHPAGSISMAALQRFSVRDAADAVGRTAALTGSAHHRVVSGAGDVVSIPYAFPTAGPYRTWIQMKHGGRILTAAFRADIRPK